MDVPSYLLGKQAGGGGGQPSLQNKSVTITENGTQNITADAGYDGLSSVEVITNVSGGGGLDWSAIGYSEEPDTGIEDGYEYAIEVKNNWTPVTSLLNKFNANEKIKFMPLVDTSIATNMSQMFRNCHVLSSIPQLNTSNVTDMSQMFQFAYNLRNMPLLDTRKVTNMELMFASCVSLQEIPQLNTSNVTSMRETFASCKSLLKISQLNTSNVTNMSSMFSGCESLINVPQLSTSNVTDMSSMFGGCVSLNDTSLDNILQMCINATSYAGTKTLKTIGFQYTNMTSKYPASRIQALPHYQDFIDAGWTIGY